jgi:hypothetical protein
MKLGKRGGDPTSRRRRAPDAALLQAQEIVRRHVAGESVRGIARAVGLAPTSVHCVIAEYRRAKEATPLERELDPELDALFAKLDDEGMDFEDARTPEDVMRLDNLQLFRLERAQLPANHPAIRAWEAAKAAGWNW